MSVNRALRGRDTGVVEEIRLLFINLDGEFSETIRYAADYNCLRYLHISDKSRALISHVIR